MDETLSVVGYARVSTQEQVRSGAGLEDQRRAILRECEHRGWNLVDLLADAGASGRSIKRRPALAEAIRVCEEGQAQVLVTSKLDRLSRSVVDFGQLLQRAKRKGWRIVVIDLGVDTTTANGQMIAHVIAAVAEWEASLIGERTTAALAVKRDQGVRLGRPPSLPPDVRQHIAGLRADGLSYARIAGALNDEGVPTAQGGRCWHPATVRKVLLAP